ncbi:MAG: RDD family protein [Oscillatoriales cyanobacterium C42_A2020_001]|nr:RDD family protein [Leptolyngbyaceae cyanobacterium C42_A2020_001]
MSGQLVLTQRYPNAPMDRRVGAFAIDVAVTALPSLLLGGGGLYILLFLALWFVSRVLVVTANQGQSLGRWAMDLKVVNPRFRIIPGIVPLMKREAITGIGCVLILIGLVNLSPTNGFLLIAPIPLLVDCSFAFTDSKYRQAFHDRLATTLITQTRRGYSLDLKFKKFIAQARHRMK